MMRALSEFSSSYFIGMKFLVVFVAMWFNVLVVQGGSSRWECLDSCEGFL